MAIAAAIERAKAQKAEALQTGTAPKNIEAASSSVQQEIAEIDARRQAVGIVDATPTAPAPAQADKQAAIAAAIARAKAQKAAAEAAKLAVSSEKKE